MVQKQKNSTSVLARALPQGCCEDEESVNVAVRRISNGFIKRTSRYGPGVCEFQEEFSREKPQIEAQSEPRQSGALKSAIDSLK